MPPFQILFVLNSAWLPRFGYVSISGSPKIWNDSKSSKKTSDNTQLSQPLRNPTGSLKHRLGAGRRRMLRGKGSPNSFPRHRSIGAPTAAWGGIAKVVSCEGVSSSICHLEGIKSPVWSRQSPRGPQVALKPRKKALTHVFIHSFGRLSHSD